MAQFWAIIKTFRTTMTIFKQLVDLYMAEKEKEIREENVRRAQELEVITYASRKAIEAKDDDMVMKAHRMRISYITREK